MKKLSKLFLFALVLMVIMLIPNLSKAATHTVSNATDLSEKITQAETGDTISLDSNIALTGPIEISDKNLIIDGNGHTVSRDASWSVPGTNASFFTAGGSGTTVTLKDIVLTGSLKYGAQAYNGGHLILNGVEISNCAYAGILANGGTLEIIDLTLGHNHEPDNVGIEIGMGQDVSSTPKVIMNGSITTDEDENVIYIADNDELTTFDVENTDDSEQKIYIEGNQVVVADSENNILFKSNETEVDIGGTEYVENKTVTLHVNDNVITFTVMSGTTLTKEDLESKIDLDALELTGYTIAGFYTTADFTTEFRFATPITENTVIYTKLNEPEMQTPDPEPEPKPEPEQTPAPSTTPEPERDVTPKTGDTNVLGIVIATLSVLALGVALFKKREF